MYKHGEEGHFILNYIIEDANVVSDLGITIASFLIDDYKISHYGKSLQKYQGMRMNVSKYFMTPGHVIADFSLLNCENIVDYRKQLTNLIVKGCTLALVPCYIQYESEFEKKIRAARHAMINSTIDFVIGVQIPLEKLTPGIIRLCKRHKLPYIITEINEHTNIYSIPWGWIREAQFQFQVPIYPLWNIEDYKELKIQMESWEQVTSSHYIPTYLRFPTDLRLVPKVIRKQIGIYPKKGDLFIGNELDYNLYEYANYDKIVPLITVHKGKVIKVNDEVNLYPGFGQELNIKLPGLFASIDSMTNNPYPGG